MKRAGRIFPETDDVGRMTVTRPQHLAVLLLLFERIQRLVEFLVVDGIYPDVLVQGPPFNVNRRFALVERE
jgi:hypothetical protein